VADERVPINHGEAVVWPADELHAAWTDGSEMRAILVELMDVGHPRIVDGEARRVRSTGPDAAPGVEVTPARGSLAERPRTPEDHDESEGEPW
jgi:hypothetical protein